MGHFVASASSCHLTIVCSAVVAKSAPYVYEQSKYKSPSSASDLPPATLRQRSLALLPRSVPPRSEIWARGEGRAGACGCSTGIGKCNATSCRDHPECVSAGALGVRTGLNAPCPCACRGVPPRASCPRCVSVLLLQTLLFCLAARPGAGRSDGRASARAAGAAAVAVGT